MKKILFLSMVLLFLFGMTTMVIATDPPPTPPETTTQTSTVTLIAKAYRENNTPIGINSKVAPGEKFYIKLSLKDINPPTTNIKMISTKIGYNTMLFNRINQQDISYDKDVFMLAYNDNNDLHELTLISGIGVNGSQEVELATIPVEAKTGLESQDATISFTENRISDNQEHNLNISENSETIVKFKIGIENITGQPLDHIEISKKPTKIAYKPGEKFDPKGMEITAVYKDKTKMKVTDYTYVPKGETKDRELKLTDKFITISYMDKKIDLSISVNEEGKIPQTGITDHPFIALSILAIAVISFVGIRKYRNI